MKKTSVFLFGMFCTIVSFAQSKPHFALKGGVNLADLKVEGYNNRDVRVGLHLGATAHMHITPQWAIQPELLYSQEGGKINNINGRDTYAKYKNDYINIPLMLQYMFDNGFRLEAGPQLGLLVNSKIEDQDDVEVDAGDVFKSTNVSLGAGLSYLSYSGLGIGGRYNFGLSNVGEGVRDIKNSTFQISLFYMLDPAHKRKSR